RSPRWPPPASWWAASACSAPAGSATGPAGWTCTGSRSADGHLDLVGGHLGVGVDHPERVLAGSARHDVGRERVAAHRHRHREVRPRAVLETLHLQDRALARGIGAGEVDLLHRRDTRLARAEVDALLG